MNWFSGINDGEGVYSSDIAWLKNMPTVSIPMKKHDQIILSFAGLFLTPFVVHVIKFRTLKQLRDLLSLIEIAFVCYSHI